jgi:putative oxidoreductase
MKYLVLSGRILFSLIFFLASFDNFSASSIGYAAGKGVPVSSILVPFSGAIILIASLSIILGYKARWGAWLIIVFLIPVTLVMHNFWTITDTVIRNTQQAMFMKNLSMLGGALLIVYFGAGPLSFDSKFKMQ